MNLKKLIQFKLKPQSKKDDLCLKIEQINVILEKNENFWLKANAILDKYREGK